MTAATNSARRADVRLLFILEITSLSRVLKRKLQCELDLARVASRGQETKFWCAEGGGVDRILRSGLGKLQIGVIEHVKKFSAELEPGPLRDGEYLEEGEVPDLVPRSLDGVTSHISERPKSRISECAGVNPRRLHSGTVGCEPTLRDGELAVRIRIGWHRTGLEGVADQIGPRLAVRIGEAVGIENGERVSGRETCNSTNLPSPYDVIEGATGATEHGFAVAERQLVEITQN